MPNPFLDILKFLRIIPRDSSGDLKQSMEDISRSQSDQVFKLQCIASDSFSNLAQLKESKRTFSLSSSVSSGGEDLRIPQEEESPIVHHQEDLMEERLNELIALVNKERIKYSHFFLRQVLRAYQDYQVHSGLNVQMCFNALLFQLSVLAHHYLYPFQVDLKSHSYYEGKEKFLINYNPKLARRIYQFLADCEQVDGLYHTASCWERGQGGKKDFSLALEYYNKALKRGSLEAYFALKRLGQLSDGEQPPQVSIDFSRSMYLDKNKEFSLGCAYLQDDFSKYHYFVFPLKG